MPSASARATARTWATSTGSPPASAELGLLHPVVVRPDGLLIAGERRLRAAQLLGWSEIPVSVVDLDAVVRGEFAENAVRKDFTLSEAVAIKRALEPMEKAAAKERQGTPHGDKHPGKLPTSSRARRRQGREGDRHGAAARWRRPRPSSTPPRPSPRSSASCSPTWTEPAGRTASIAG